MQRVIRAKREHYRKLPKAKDREALKSTREIRGKLKILVKLEGDTDHTKEKARGKAVDGFNQKLRTQLGRKKCLNRRD